MLLMMSCNLLQSLLSAYHLTSSLQAFPASNEYATWNGRYIQYVHVYTSHIIACLHMMYVNGVAENLRVLHINYATVTFGTMGVFAFSPFVDGSITHSVHIPCM